MADTEIDRSKKSSIENKIDFETSEPSVEVTMDEVASVYNTWTTYDKGASAVQYKGPLYAAQFLNKYLQDQLDSEILDVAAGSGRVACELRKLGFSNLHALDPATEAFQRSEHRTLYKTYQPVLLGGDMDNDIADSTYDAIVISGGFCHGHLPCSALSEMIRIIKPGGYFVNVMQERYLAVVPEYAGRLEPTMRQLEEDGKWKQLERVVVDDYSVYRKGVIYVFSITKTC